MVRIKNRYLLVHILYPEPSKPDAGPKSHTTGNKPPDLLQFHSPSSDDLTPQVLAGFIKDQVQYMYGEYGLGLVASSLVGTFPIRTLLKRPNPTKRVPSKILLTCNLYHHYSLRSRPIQTCVVGPDLHNTTTQDL